MFAVIWDHNYDHHITIGGADGHYTLVDDDDLRQDNLTSGVKYLIKGIHTTIEHHYNQTMNFLVASNDTSHAVVRVILQYW